MVATSGRLRLGEHWVSWKMRTRGRHVSGEERLEWLDSSHLLI